MTRYHTRPTSDVQPVITAAELAEFTGTDVLDPLLLPLATAATAAVIEFLQSELIDRERVVTYEYWPSVGTVSGASLSRSDAQLDEAVVLPYARLSSPVALSVLVNDELTTDYRVLDMFPAEIKFSRIPATGSDAPAIKATYNAGFGTINDVPQVIKTGVTMVADYLYNHRGECTADDAIKKSGADVLLFPYKAHAVNL